MTTLQALQAQFPNMTVVDAFWTVYVANMNVGRRSHIEVPIALKFAIGQDGMRILETRFRNMIEAPVTVTEVPSQAMIRIAPAHNIRGHDQIIPGAQKAKPRTSSKAKIARPPNAFILYRQHHHPLVKAEYPNLHNNQISVILGSQWKQESVANKTKFAKLALCLKAKHLQEHPGYQYQPRKPSEKKRRQSRKIAKSENAVNGQISTSSLISQSEPNDKASNPLATQAPAAALPGGFPAVTTLGPAAGPSLAPGSINPAPSTNNSGVFVRPFEISKTATGNAVFELGGEDLDDDQLAAMLEEYNNNVPPALTPQAVAVRQNATPVLYQEPTEDAQNDANFYSNMGNFDDFLTYSSLDDFFDFQAASSQSPKP